MRGVARLPLLLAVVLLPLAASLAAEHDRVIAWYPPPGSLDGYRVYLGRQPAQYTEVLDLGSVLPDPDGLGRTTLVLDAYTAYYVSMTAYNGAGESDYSNEILIESAMCNASLCDDGNACTADDCDAGGCRNDPLPDGTWCSPTSGTYGLCSAGWCETSECLENSHCDDGDICNGLETCSLDGCSSGTPLSCGVSSQCSDPACDPRVGCVTIPAADGITCDDGNKWTLGDRCRAGVCSGTRSSKPGKGLGRGKNK